MALTLRVTPGEQNKRLIAKLDPAVASVAILRGNSQFSAFLKTRLVRMSHQKVKKRTGTLAKRWRVLPRVKKITITNPARSKINQTPYVIFLELGTKRHFVGPKPGRQGKGGKPPALAWRKGGKGPISAAKITTAGGAKNFNFSKGHFVRGIKPRKIFSSAFEPMKGNLPKLIFTELRFALRADTRIT